jgi:group I intron endonuclease
MTESIYLIYKHTSPSGKSYIGQTKDYEQRCQQHRAEKSNCRAFSAAIKKYGWDNFTHEMLVECITEDEANTLEVKFILEHHTLSPGGYNLREGGRNRSPSCETRAKMSASQKGRIHTEESKAKISAASSKLGKGKGKVLSDEHKAKISMASKGRIGKPHSNESKAKMSTSATGRKHSDATLVKISTNASHRIGIPRSIETKAKMRASRYHIPYEDALLFFHTH